MYILRAVLLDYFKDYHSLCIFYVSYLWLVTVFFIFGCFPLS